MKTADLRITKIKIISFVAILCGMYYLGWRSGSGTVKVEEKVKIHTVQEKVKENIVITESPDGTKVTEINRDTQKDVSQAEQSRKIVKNEQRKWLVDLRASSEAIQGNFSEATYTLGVAHKIAENSFLGLWGNTKGTWGITFGLQF